LFRQSLAAAKEVCGWRRMLTALARVKRVLNDYTLASDLDRQFGDLPVGLRKILLSMIHGLARA
jgi:hypothetical protein